MRRRVLLVIGSFAALLVAFLGYELVSKYTARGPRQTLRRTHETNPAEDGPATRASDVPGAPGEPKVGYDVFIAPRADDGRLEGEYKFRKWEKIADYTYLLTGPDVLLYVKDGQTVRVRSDSGKMTIDRSGRYRPRRLTLTGHVQIDIDRGTSPGMPPLSERPRDHVRILMEAVEFDNELLSIRSNGDVEVYSSEADIFGRGLLITWKEAPRELEMLRLERGRRIVVKEIPQQLDVISPLGAGKKPVEIEEAPPEEALAGEVETVRAPSTTGPATRGGKAPAEEAKPQAQNVYVAELYKNVRVTSDDRVLKDAEKVELKFEWDRTFQERRRKTPGAEPTTQPAAAPAAATKPAPAAKPDVEPPLKTMVIDWDGPLVLRPVGYVEQPSRKRYAVKASGQDVYLGDSETTAHCKSVVFESDDKQGGIQQHSYLNGTRAEPVILAMVDGSKVTCEKMRFDHQAGKAYLEGPGEMIAGEDVSRYRRADEGATSRPAATRPATTQPATTQPAEKQDRIAWRDGVVVTFGEETISLPDGRTRLRRFIDEAAFGGKVELSQGSDFVHCDELDVKMARGAEGKMYPARAVAAGSVHARQEGSEVQAETVTVEFEEFKEIAAAGEKARMRVRPMSLEAKGGVKISDKRQDEVFMAEAELLRSDLVNRRAVLYGAVDAEGRPIKPAYLAQGQNKLSGDEIRLFEVVCPDGRKDFEVRVHSPGQISFLTAKDMDSQQLKEPRAITIGWSKAMYYQGQRDIAEFFGDIALDSGPDHMSCQAMRVWFDKPQPATKPAEPEKKPDAQDKTRRGLAVGMEQYSKRSIKTILADKEVLLLRRLEDDKGQLLRRQQLRSDQLAYDVRYKRVNVYGPGSMVAEDYEPPKAGTKDSGTGGQVELTGRINSPSQTVMKWDTGMDYLQELRQLVMSGDVTMVHRSGSEIVAQDGMKLPDYGVLTSGRATDLRCEKLMVEFDETPKSKEGSTTRPANEGPRLGPLKRFSATRGVNIKDGPRQVLAQRVIYDRPLDIVVIWGFLSGNRPEDAQFIHEDPATGRSQTWSSAKIIWFRQNDQVITEDIKGSGAR